MTHDANAGAADAHDVVIERLGAQGDGVASGPGGEALFVAYALPGERVRVEAEGERGRLVEVLTPSADRVAPPCPHFTVCGGCTLQHLAPAAYSQWKRQLVVDAFAQRGLEIDVTMPWSSGPASRRRAVLSAVREAAIVRLGFHEARSSDIFDIETCAVLDRGIVAALPQLRSLLARLPAWSGEARVVVLMAAEGLDVTVQDAAEARSLTAAQSAALASEAARLRNLLRLSIEATPVYQRALPFVAMGPARVEPPPGVFLQASGEAETFMAERVVAALPRKAKAAVDLFCGLGAFTFPLAQRVAVQAFDSDAPALQALAQAAKSTQGIKPVGVRRRDLIREPLSRKELEGFDLAVFDPPRAGARAQAEMLARSRVPVVVAVSCNPGTLARDARILIDGGYRLAEVVAVDQFHWTAHVEAVAVFAR